MPVLRTQRETRPVSEPLAGWAKLDFFVSYAEADRGWAEWIAWQLEDFGFRVLLQAWDFVPGSNWISTMPVSYTHLTLPTTPYV